MRNATPNFIREDTPLEKINDPLLEQNQVTLYIKRDELNHKEISGNKWRKLKYNIVELKRQNIDTVLTFGGAYSNHISATAAAGKLFGFKTIGVIRGEEYPELNPTLQFAAECNMRLHYMDRTTYRKKESEEVIRLLRQKYGVFFLIPQGGANIQGIKGCMEIVDSAMHDFDYLCCACGTGATLTGIITQLKSHQTALGFPALKNGEFLRNDVNSFLKQLKNCNDNWQLITNYHFGGFAKYNSKLIDFIVRFKELHNVRLDPVYTGKTVYGIYDLAQTGFFPKGSKICVIHTGGIQGLEGFKHRYNLEIGSSK
ncbi:MAG: 1-aminocyclopropane-1-carboxylate deaminase/D-cysteine desulfhydrase [Candidatus Anammoxibacter sp.]